MKTIGLIGGMSWESTLEYYRLINERIRDSISIPLIHIADTAAAAVKQIAQIRLKSGVLKVNSKRGTVIIVDSQYEKKLCNE